MKKSQFKKLSESLVVGQEIRVTVAHTYRYGFHGDYSEDAYQFVGLKGNSIVGRNLKHSHELITITPKYLSSGYMRWIK